MPLHRITATFAACVLALVLAPVALAGPPADKGKPVSAAQGQGQGQGSGKSQADEHAGAHDAGAKGASGDKGKESAHDDADNHGQAVSECNHRANDKKLKGKERQEYLEWCTDHGERAKYDDRRYDQDRSCYRRADEKGLGGDFRRVYIKECLQKQEKNR